MLDTGSGEDVLKYSWFFQMSLLNNFFKKINMPDVDKEGNKWEMLSGSKICNVSGSYHKIYLFFYLCDTIFAMWESFLTLLILKGHLIRLGP